MANERCCSIGSQRQRPWASSGRWPLFMFIAVVLAATSTNCASTNNCNSGILQMKPLPQEETSCYEYRQAPTSSSIKALCMSALRVRVTNGTIKLVPLDLNTYNYSYPITPHGMTALMAMDCKDVNASGLFYPGSSTAATVMLYDDYGRALTFINKNGTDQITLIPGQDNSCRYQYTVAQGCVMGVRAPTTPRSGCPAGFQQATGRFNTPYCAPCPGGTYSDKPGAACKPCPPGSYSGWLGATRCQACPARSYSTEAGSSWCRYCTDSGQWTDGKNCATCPKGSYPSGNYNQCVRCDAGKKCCTVGWGKGCPKCPAGGSAPKAYTSIFALEAATPSSCLATHHALCTPKINITVGSDCIISLINMHRVNPDSSNDFCSWSTSVSVNGTQLSITDIGKLDEYYTDNDRALAAGNFTTAAPSYLIVSVPKTKCTLRYRALTSPFARLLGLAPKPSNSQSCPAGQYLESNTDAKPGPCLLCPPGAYSPRTSNGRNCFRCPAGTYTDRYGGIKCNRCPAGRIAKFNGSTSCVICTEYDEDIYPSPDNKQCLTCPKDSKNNGKGGRTCLGNAYGSICCAAGDCSGQTPCSGPRKPIGDWWPESGRDTYTAVLQLLSNSLQLPSCTKALLLSCLGPRSKVLLTASSADPVALQLRGYGSGITCANNEVSYEGHYTGTKTARVSGYETGNSTAYNIISDSAKSTIIISFLGADTADASSPQQQSPTSSNCSATFKLLSGYAFDLSRPKDAVCAPNEAVVTYSGRQFCRPCDPGHFLNRSAGKCHECPAGYFSDVLGATACKPCPAGYQCWRGMTKPRACSGGYYANKPRAATDCLTCPPNTASNVGDDSPTVKCAACPQGTIAPEGSVSCGVPWDKTFPA